MSDTTIRHMLTFDVEEYFHCEVFRNVIGPTRWDRWPSRIGGQIDELLELLADADVRATFFVLGHVADVRPGIVHQISAAGHEIACHGQSHEMIERLGPDRIAGLDQENGEIPDKKEETVKTEG